MKIALTGGIACGKSTLAKFLGELGICLLDADDVVHELEAPGGAAVPAIVRRFGAEVQAPDGSIDRKRLADIVFSDGPARRDLEAILFPLVRARLNEFVMAAHRDGSPSQPPPVGRTVPGRANRPGGPPATPPTSAAPADPGRANRPGEPPATNHQFRIAIIPLLFESHWEGDYDTIIAIASSVERQIERMMRARGYSCGQAKARLAAQLPIAEKVRRADYVVVNDSTPEHLRDEAGRLLAWLKERRKYEH